MTTTRTYDLMTVPEAAGLLEAKETYVYRLIREGRLVPAQTEPQLKLAYPSLVDYLRQRIPSTFRLEEAF